MNIIYEDKYILAVQKPSKIPSQSDKTGDKDMISFVKEYLSQKHPNIKNHYIGLVHRLDRPVAGIMLFAKTKEANSDLSNQIQTKEFKKQYLAVVCGYAENSLKLIDYIYKIERLNISRIVSKGTHNSKEAILEYNVLQNIKTEKGELALLKVDLHTGRHHQIRVQLANAGLPIWGDVKYNNMFKSNREWVQIALWAYSITFKHPKTQKTINLNILPQNQYPFTEFKDYNI